jgi:hypothetical protein
MVHGLGRRGDERTPGSSSCPSGRTPSSSSTSSSSGIRSRRGPISACAWPRASPSIGRRSTRRSSSGSGPHGHGGPPRDGVRRADRGTQARSQARPRAARRSRPPNGFDAGELAAAPPYTTAGEAIVNDSPRSASGCASGRWTRAPYLSAWREKKLKGVVLGRARRGRQCGHASRGARDQGRHVRLRRHSGGG